MAFPEGNKEIGDIAKTGRGVLYEEQLDGTFARVLSILLRAFDPVGSHLQDTTIAAATTLSAPPGANKLLIQAFGANVRYTLDGVDPTATFGFQLKADDPPIVIPFGPTTIVKVIEETTTATVDFQFGV